MRGNVSVIFCRKNYKPTDTQTYSMHILRSAKQNCLTVPCCRLSMYTVGRLITQAQQSGTRCQTSLEIRTVSIVVNGSWKQISLSATSVTSALEVLSNEMCYTNLKSTFYLLTYFHKAALYHDDKQCLKILPVQICMSSVSQYLKIIIFLIKWNRSRKHRY